MTVINRSFIYKRRIKVSEEDLRLAKSGKKTCTIRLGRLGVEGTRVDLYDGRESLPVEITFVENQLLYRDLTDDHARREGFTTLTELQQDLGSYYRNIDEAQPITVINFRAV